MKRPLRLFAATCLAASLLLVPACGAPTSTETPETTDTAKDAATAGDSRTVIFDMAHGEIFGPDNTDRLGQSKLVEHIKNAGLDVDVRNEPLTAQALEDAVLVVLAGPMRPLGEDEVKAVDAFVQEGGTVLITTHVPQPIAQMAQAFGLQLSTAVLQKTNTAEGTDPGELIASVIAADELTKDVRGLYVISGWGVRPLTPHSKVIVSTDPNTWADVNGNSQDDKTDAHGEFGIVGVTRAGKGTIIIAGDDAIFANEAIDQADNQRLLDNILLLTEVRTRPL